ncbi:MAG: methyltransferase domain-containing protein [Candidatus Algichlamydia australiensis]|nr:methyltransferase domain-containing protein [Chlamydiales bacterium]
MTDLYDGSYYSNHSIHQKNFAKEFLKNLKIAPKSLYLDMGCGDGKITSDIAEEHDLTALGVDRSASMIAFANENYHKDNISFLQDDAEDYVKPEKFDLITSLTMLHWVNNPQKALQNIYKSLKKNGTFYLLLSPRESELFQIYLKTLRRKKWREIGERVIGTNRKYYDEYLKILREAGFTIENAFLKDRFVLMNNLDDYKKHVRSFVQNIVLLKEDEIEEFIEDVAQEASDFFEKDEKGRMIVKGRGLGVICRKL